MTDNPIRIEWVRMFRLHELIGGGSKLGCVYVDFSKEPIWTSAVFLPASAGKVFKTTTSKDVKEVEKFVEGIVSRWFLKFGVVVEIRHD